MTDVKKSAYLAEAQTALDTDLNSDADGQYTALSGEYDNSTTGYMFMDVEINLASADFTTPGGTDMAYEIYVVPSLDGTNYPNTDNTATTTQQENNQYFVGSTTLESVNGAVRMVLTGVEVPAGKWKMFGRNMSNRTLAASGNTIKWRPWGYKSA